MEKQPFEQSGLIPRSIIRTFDRFRKQLLPGAENVIIQEFRISRYQVLVSVKSLIALVFIPLIINFLLKTFLLTPLTEFFWNNYQSEIFLNSYQQNRALKEVQNFEEKLYFETLIEEKSFYALYNDQDSLDSIDSFKMIDYSQGIQFPLPLDSSLTTNQILKKRFQQKTIEIAFEYNQQSILAVTNIFGDFFTFLTILILFIVMKPQIIILKSFLIESIYSLSDTTKSFLLIFFTDLLVGFHSPRGWDLVLEIFLQHFGLPENKDFILLFVATFPVLLDTVFKYWIFRYLNKISPSTVATYHNMIE